MILILACVYVISPLIAGQEATTATETTTSKNHGRVVGGLSATEGQFPWQVAIYKSRSNSNYYFVCGGILIGNNWVLSAAHCFTESDITGLLLQFGIYDLSNPSEETQRRSADSYLNHPDYNPTTFRADISLLRFSESLSYNYYSQPVGLPSISTTVTPGQPCIVSGFGETRGTGTSFSVIRYAEVPIVSLATCNQWYSDIGVTVADDHICAGYEGGGVDTCQGDSGGPLVCPASSDSSLYVVQGITSFGYDCAVSRKPGAYTSVLSYIDWIVLYTKLETGTGIPLIPNYAMTKHLHGNCIWLILIGLFITHGAIF